MQFGIAESYAWSSGGFCTPRTLLGEDETVIPQTEDISFAGNNEDTTTNLYDAMYREYGIQGRWPSPDPLGVAAVNPANPQTWNRYAYVYNNPLLLTDVSGTRGCYTVEAVPGDTSQQTSGNGPFDASDAASGPYRSGKCGAPRNPARDARQFILANDKCLALPN